MSKTPNQSMLVGIVETKAQISNNDIDLPQGFHAYVKTVAIAESTDKFDSLVSQKLNDMGLIFIGSEEISPIKAGDLKALTMGRIEASEENPVMFMTFQAFDPREKPSN